MKYQDKINIYKNQVIESINRTKEQYIYDFAKKIVDTKNTNGNIFVFGNGANENIATHFSLDLINRYKLNVKTYNEPSYITALSNDYGFEKWIENTINNYASENDLIILLSSSGESKNIINAALSAQKKNCFIITLSGFSKNNKLYGCGNLNHCTESNSYNVIELNHHYVLLSVVELIKELL